ncbi:MAG TPA: hypothetical protein VGB46_08070 [Flavisolibacter sp.]
MIEVFKTNVKDATEAGRLTALLRHHFPGSRINFDIHDCDRILRIEGKDFRTGEVETLVQENGFACSVLE